MSQIIDTGPVYSLTFGVASVAPTPCPIAAARREAPSRFSDDGPDYFMLSSLRTARLNAIRAEIKNGTYETPARITATVDRLLDVLTR